MPTSWRTGIGLQVDPNPIWVQPGRIYTSNGFSAGIDLALAWVAEDCGSGIATAAARELAHRVSMSVRNFCRVFAGDVGTTPARYVLHLRVEAARRLLHSSPHDLGRVARAAGFGSVESMRQAFVQVLGKSPREMCAAPERNGAS